MDAADLAGAVRELARDAGFDLVGVTTAEPVPEAEAALRRALEAGRLATLPWMTPERAHLATHPLELFPPARSILVVGLGYLTPDPGGLTPGVSSGRLARYAWGEDYHRILRRKLRRLCRETEALIVRPIAARICVDTAPLAERALAQRAGLGWQGRNCTLIAPGLGSWFVLGEVLWDLELPPDPPASGSCGDCDRCLRACPAGALVAPYTLDVSRCLSYLTIEHHDDIPAGLRDRIGDRLFGCDACQEACPHNARARVAAHPEFAARHGSRLPLSLFLPPDASPAGGPAPATPLDEAGFARRFADSPLRRAGLAGLQRNARAIAGT